MKYSFNSFVFSSGLSWLPTYTIDYAIEKLAELGYDAMELGCAAPHAWPDYVTPEKLSAIKRCFNKNKLKCSSILVLSGGGPGLNTSSYDSMERENAVRMNKKTIDIGYELECPTLLYVGGWYGLGMSKREAWKYTVDALKEIADHAAAKNMMVCVEPTADESNLIECADDAIDMMKDSGRDNVSVMFDVEHVLFRVENPTDYVARMGKDLKHIHMTDAKRVPPGDGHYDFLPLMQALKDIKYSGYVTMETGFGRIYRPDEVARRSINHLKEIEKKLK